MFLYFFVSFGSSKVYDISLLNNFHNIILILVLIGITALLNFLKFFIININNGKTPYGISIISYINQFFFNISNMFLRHLYIGCFLSLLLSVFDKFLKSFSRYLIS
ncbi:MAG: hypothetical protein BWY04_00521 [candidate division CPR1 bacterium ADurb.Bin160]|uniref:Uncharacterized protein n=1 Tax=candidate division CPR1 bacterium ADurb.Bin160 TaxID=1852826 RepID=A0A1V5ZP98_9BACT|nr:MAG: hypothetical protein BWY04_00521 [candidate division CPR1 bacterium ADurb.Bin160]